MRLSKTQIALFLALLLGNAIILYSDFRWGWLRFPAALAMTFVLPGWAWLPAFNWLQTSRAIERFILGPGLSSLLSALALLVALFIPGSFTETPALVALNLATLTGLLLQFLRPLPSPLSSSNKIKWPARPVLLILLAIFALAMVTRLTRLGYAEFHEDELENMRLIVRAYKGEEYAPFLDSKGPIHWLLPAGLWYLNGWLNEGIARTPFALTSLLLVPTVYVLGRRMSRGRDSIGLLAAGFVAVNGFFIAYARQVENQSLIIFWGALGMWFAYRYYTEGIKQFLPWIALCLAVGLIAHPDVLLYLPVFAYIIGAKLWINRTIWRQQWPWLVGSGLLFTALSVLFYVPYLLDPNIGLVYQYFQEDRIGSALFYNRVGNFFDQDKLYSTRYHAPVLILLLLWMLGRNFAQGGRWGVITLSGLLLAAASSVIWPAVWEVGSLNLAFAPYLLLILLFILLPGTPLKAKVFFLWFSLPMWALLFLAKDAADHIQIAYPAWALLGAFALADLGAYLSGPTGRSVPAGIMPTPPTPLKMLPALRLALQSALVLVLAVIVPLILFYQYLTFNSPVTTYWQAKVDYETNPNSWYGSIYGSISRPRKLFGNPRLGGWKVVGHLWETGTLSGDFRSVNESFAVPIWYTFQTPRSCYNDPQNYWLRRDWKGWPEEEQQISQNGYVLTRIVLVDQEPKLHLYEKEVPPQEPEILDLADYRHKFDLLATPARFAQAEPMSQTSSLNFDDKLLLRGYDLPRQTARPGQRVPVTVYWEALAPMEIRYRGFVHLVGPDQSRWGQHDDDPACRLLTSDMRPGQHSSRQFRLPVQPDTPPGEYEIVFGLYDPNTLERLEIWDRGTGQPIGTSLVLGRITVE